MMHKIAFIVAAIAPEVLYREDACTRWWWRRWWIGGGGGHKGGGFGGGQMVVIGGGSAMFIPGGFGADTSRWDLVAGNGRWFRGGHHSAGHFGGGHNAADRRQPQIFRRGFSVWRG